MKHKNKNLRDELEKKFSFTPGPWTVDKMDDYGVYRINEAVNEQCELTDRRQILAELHHEGNRRLIQEALYMLLALEELADALDNALMTHIFESEKDANESWYLAAIENARAIIERVKGRNIKPSSSKTPATQSSCR